MPTHCGGTEDGGSHFFKPDMCKALGQGFAVVGQEAENGDEGVAARPTGLAQTAEASRKAGHRRESRVSQRKRGRGWGKDRAGRAS